MIGKCLILVAVVSLLSFSSVAQQASPQPTPLPCTKEVRDPSQPWVHDAKVLESFPKDNPLPLYVGAFRDKHWNYQLILFKDAQGVFGELLSPVLEADSPTSRIYKATFDPKSGALQFSAKFRMEQIKFTGVLRSRIIKGTVEVSNRNEKITLKKIKWYDDDEELPYTSRAQFDCAMILYGRY